MSCGTCKFNSPYGCDAADDDVCPMEKDDKREVVYPCPRCGRDLDGYGVCPTCGWIREAGWLSLS